MYMLIKLITFRQVGIEPTTSRVYSHMSHNWPQMTRLNYVKILLVMKNLIETGHVESKFWLT